MTPLHIAIMRVMSDVVAGYGPTDFRLEGGTVHDPAVQDGPTVKVQFACTSPYRLGPLIETTEGILVASLKDPARFAQVHVGPFGEVSWGDELELCSDALYLQITGKTSDEVFATPAFALFDRCSEGLRYALRNTAIPRNPGTSRTSTGTRAPGWVNR